MNLGTMVQQILDDTHSLVSADSIKRKIIDSMNFHRSKHYFWGEGTLSFPMIVGQADYGPADPSFPQDLAEIIGDSLYSLTTGSTMRREVRRIDSSTMERWRAQPTLPQPPIFFDVWNNKLRFDRAAISTDTITGRYTTDISVPKVSYAASVYSFFQPDGVTALTDAFTNSWLVDDKGAQALRHDVMSRLYQHVLKDADSAMAEKTAWLEMIAELEVQTDQRVGGPQRMVPQLLGEESGLWPFRSAL